MSNDVEHVGPSDDKEEQEQEPERFMAQFAGFMARFGPQASPIYETVTEKHITHALENQAKGMDVSLEDRKGQRSLAKFVMVVVAVVVLGLAGGLIYAGSAETVETMVTILVSAGIGGAGGYGLGRRTSQ